VRTGQPPHGYDEKKDAQKAAAEILQDRQNMNVSPEKNLLSPMKFAIVPGHNSIAPGAGLGGLHEYPVMAVLAEMIAQRVPSEYEVEVVRRPERENALSHLVSRLNDCGVDRVLSLHLNAVEGDSPDYGYPLHYPGAAAARSFAGRIADTVQLDGIERKRPRTRENLLILSHTRMPVVLDEIAFIDRRDHQHIVLSQLPMLADMYAEAVTYEIEAVLEATDGRPTGG
jgi:N-acetylmuramoyl-L-alanine amidase